MPRIKSAAPSLTRDQVETLVGEITKRDNERAELNARMNAELDAIRAKHTERITQLTLAIDAATTTLESWARANQDQFDGTRSLEFTRGTIGFRLGQYTVKPTKGNTLKTVLEAIKRSTWGQSFLRIKEELDKEALVAARADITAEQAARAGFTFEQQDRFYVEPKQDVPAVVGS